MSNTLIWDDTIKATGTSGRGRFEGSPYSFETTVARFVAIAYGPEGHRFPFHEDSDDKVSVYFVGTFNGKVFTLYDYKRDQQIHIGGSPDLDVEGLIQELRRLFVNAAPAPWSAVQRNYVKQTIGYMR